MQSRYDGGYIIASDDAENAFNSFSRQAIHDQAQKDWQEATGTLKLFYGQRSIVLYVYRRDDGHTVVSVIYSEEGTRAGCRLGSIIFDMVFQPIYEACEEDSGLCHSRTHG
jgi:hypothetical protein